MSDNSSIKHQFIDDAFDPLKNDNIELIVHVGQGSLAYAYFDSTIQQIVALESFSLKDPLETIDKIFQDKAWKGKNFKAVKVGFENDYFSLIPDPLFNENKLKAYINLNQEMLPEQDFIYLSDPLTKLNIRNAYALANSDMKMLKDHFPKVLIKHHMSVLLEALRPNLKNQAGESSLFINFRDNAIDILYFKDMNLHFCKSFPYKTGEDVLYHILHACNYLKLDSKKIPFVLLGQIDDDLAEYHLLEQYLARVNMIAGSDLARMSKIPSDIKRHLYFTLLSLSQCES